MLIIICYNWLIVFTDEMCVLHYGISVIKHMKSVIWWFSNSSTTCYYRSSIFFSYYELWTIIIILWSTIFIYHHSVCLIEIISRFEPQTKTFRLVINLWRILLGPKFGITGRKSIWYNRIISRIGTIYKWLILKIYWSV